MKRAIRIAITAIICIGLVLGYYYYLSHRQDGTSSESSADLTEVDIIISQDFSKNYPSTPRAVVKWYNRIITALYAQDYTDAQFEAMADQIRALLDEELLSYNERITYLASLKADVANYKNREKTIVQSSVSSSNDITYETVNGYYCAYVQAYYFCREGSAYSRTYEEFVLRKDDSGNWKILTFQQVEGDANDW